MKRLTKKQEKEMDDFVELATADQIDELCWRILQIVQKNES